MPWDGGEAEVELEVSDSEGLSTGFGYKGEVVSGVLLG